MQVLWTEPARIDLRRLFDYLLERNPTAARPIAATIDRQMRGLADHPVMGRPGRVAGTREFVIVDTAYVAAYTVDQAISAVAVLRVLHGAQQWPEQL